MANPDKPRSVYFVLGEDSGDALGSQIMLSLREKVPDIRFSGLGGHQMESLGLKSLFDVSSISVMGISAVIARLPLILRRIRETADDIARIKPDVVVLIDSPDFTHRVAKRVRARVPDARIIKVVCPSVWAWRPGRAGKMRAYIDHVLALLPFEPKVLADLGGPPATYIGHPMVRRFANVDIPTHATVSKDKVLLLLPGSRRTELRLLLPDFRKTLEILAERGTQFRAVLPAVPHLETEIRKEVANWPVRPEIVAGEEAKLAAFKSADAALAASGTVLLELALFRVPVISIYRLDWLMHQVRFLIYGWTAALPNLIADEAVVPERVGDMVRPGWLARALEALLRDGPERRAQLEGFDRVAEILNRSEPAAEIAARTIVEISGN
ncbi:MAG: lipid-A-disaccharide synthase [Nitratireductor sp.]